MINIAKYYWNLNDKALAETEKILNNHKHPKFNVRIITLLSRCDKPKELFSIISRKEFIEAWPKIRSHWLKLARQSDFRDWWETVYEQLVEADQQKQRKTKGKPPILFRKIGKNIKEARIKKGLTQKQLAINVGMKQPDISMIEEGRVNITLFTLIRLCKVLDIKNIDVI